MAPGELSYDFPTLEPHHVFPAILVWQGKSVLHSNISLLAYSPKTPGVHFAGKVETLSLASHCHPPMTPPVESNLYLSPQASILPGELPVAGGSKP